MTVNKKDIIKPFRMTKEEAVRLKEQAGKYNLKESEYLRLLLSGKPNDYPEIRMLLKTLINEINAIGNNINQITRNYNSCLYRPEDRELLKAYMKKLTLLLSEVVKTYGD